MTSYIIEKLKELTKIPSPTGYTHLAAEYVIKELIALGFSPKLTNKGCVVCEIGGENDPIILSAHIDTLGGMVEEIKGNGRLKITRLGGLKAENCEGENCEIRTRDGKVFSGTYMLNDPSVHVNGNYDDTKRNFDNMEVVIDEDVKNAVDVEKLGIANGDFVCFDPRTMVTESGYIKSRFLDDKLSVAILLGLAKSVAENKITLSRKTYLFITVYEEVGHGACAGYPLDAIEIMSVDMGCVGSGLKCTEKDVSICLKDSSGPYNYEVTTKLINIAKECGISYAADVYPFYGSDADAALSAGADMKHSLIGAGVYASHGYERSHIEGVKNTLNLIEAYLKKDTTN